MGYVFVEHYPDAGGEDRLGLGALVLHIIDVGQPHFLDRPSAGEKRVLLKDGLAVERHLPSRIWYDIAWSRNLQQIRAQRTFCVVVVRVQRLVSE